ncbi:MAG: hypothetical protein ACRC1P_10605 [Cellulosilyticaceae bacterium]
MNFMYLLLIIICITAIITLLIDIGVVNKNPYPLLKGICIVLFAFSILRYFTLIVYGDSPTLGQLDKLRYFYLATSIGLTIPTASAIWYITPHLRNKISYGKYLLFFLPWIIFYIYVIVMQPTQVVLSDTYGYKLMLTGEFPRYLSIAQGSFVGVIILLCITGILKYKNEYLRSQYFVLIAAQVLLALDGLTYLLPTTTSIPPFTLTEVFGFIAIFYAFYSKPLDVKK